MMCTIAALIAQAVLSVPASSISNPSTSHSCRLQPRLMSVPYVKCCFSSGHYYGLPKRVLTSISFCFSVSDANLRETCCLATLIVISQYPIVSMLENTQHLPHQSSKSSLICRFWTQQFQEYTRKQEAPDPWNVCTGRHSRPKLNGKLAYVSTAFLRAKSSRVDFLSSRLLKLRNIAVGFRLPLGRHEGSCNDLFRP